MQILLHLPWPPPSRASCCDTGRTYPNPSLCGLQVKLWNTQTGFCFVTFREHTAPVTAVAFLPSGSAVLSASLDGTVRAFDLVRYRNFRTMTSPTPMQFQSLALDPSGEVSCSHNCS